MWSDKQFSETEDMKMKKCFLTVIVSLFLVVPAMATMRDSADFTGVMYEAAAVPDAATPVWDRGPYGYASSDGNLLSIDVLAAGSVGWHLPGQWGADWVSPSNYTQGDAGNPWNPDIYTAGYTVEISTEVLAANAGAYGYVLYMGEAGHGGIIELQIFTDQIKTSAGVVMYAGDLTGAQHIIRLVRYPGAVDDPFASPYVELYVDGSLEYTGGRTSEGGVISSSAWNQDWFYMGSLSGSAHYHVRTDYVRMDFTGTYVPGVECGSLGYLKGDFDRNCVTDVADLAYLGRDWLMCTDSLDLSCINCTDPANAQFCR